MRRAIASVAAVAAFISLTSPALAFNTYTQGARSEVHSRYVRNMQPRLVQRSELKRISSLSYLRRSQRSYVSDLYSSLLSKLPAMLTVTGAAERNLDPYSVSRPSKRFLTDNTQLPHNGNEQGPRQ